MQHDFILLDRSGSMSSQWVEAVNSVNAYVKKLADQRVDTGVTLACFDAPSGALDFTILRDRIIPSTWHEVAGGEAPPRGMTPLNDAIGKIVTLAKAGNYDRLALIIMTDGMENASREYSLGSAKALLDDCRAKGWQVIFLGANFDNIAQATSYGTQFGQHVNSTTANLTGTMTNTALKRASYGVSGQAMSYSEAEKTQAKTDNSNGQGS